MNQNHEIVLDNFAILDITTCEGYLEAGYEAIAKGETLPFYYPSADSFYIKALLRDRFPDRLPPSILEIEDMLIGDGLMAPRQLNGVALAPPRLRWPPRAYTARTPTSPRASTTPEAEAATPF